MRLVAIVILSLSFVHNGFAECWVASEFKGYASCLADSYNFHQDGISGKKILINIDGDRSSVSGSEGITFIQVTPQLIVGIYTGGGYKGVVESWGIDIERRKVFYSQTRSGYLIFDGAKTFVGELEGKCK